MDCDKIRKALNENRQIDGRLLEHVENCAKCSRAIEAATILNQGFKTEGEVSKSNSTPIEELYSKIESRLETQQKENIVSQIKNQFSSRPKLIWGLGVALVAFLFITLIPFSYSVTTGYTATFDNVQPLEMGTLGSLKNSLESLGYDDVALNRHNDQVVMSGFASLDDARQAAAAFNLVTGYSGKAEYEPVIEEVSGSLYAQAISRLTIEVETAGKSDEEIASEIGQKLAAQGLLNPDVTVSTDGDMRNIQINYEGGNEHGEVIQEMQFKFDSGNDIAIEHSLSPEPMAIDTEGKTDQEIIDEVKANLSAQGVSNAQVTVHTRPDGKREIQVEAEKEIIK